MITIDERGCGQGKTTQRIYKRINSNTKCGIKTLVVVPSMQLQEQYDDSIEGITVINSDIYNKYHFQYQSTVQALINAMRDGNRLIIITHQTFMMIPKDNGYKNQYDLIIDEALDDIIDINDITYKKSNWEFNLNLDQLFRLNNNLDMECVTLDDENSQWYSFNVNRDTGDSIFNDSPTFNKITDKNYIQYTTAVGWRVLTQESEGVANIISILDPHLIEGWYDVLICAAAFEYTKMCYWMKYYGIEYQIITKFVPHVSNIRLHTDKRIGYRFVKAANKQTIIYSNTLIKRYPQVVKNYHDHINQYRVGDIISVRNNHQKYIKLLDEIRLSHNVHGLNNYQHVKNVNLETALNMHPHKEKFIREIWLSGIHKNKHDRLIYHFHSAYLFYQIIMRTNLRSRSYNNELINVFTPDAGIATTLLDYFDEANITHIEMDLLKGVTMKPINVGGRPKGTTKPNAMTPAERKRKQRAKNKS